MGYLIGYVLGLAVYVVFIAPVVAVGRALGHAGELTGRHARLVAGVVHDRTPQYTVIAPYRPDTEPQPAYRQYFFGPAQRDLRQLLTLAWRMFLRTTGDRLRAGHQRYLTGQGDDAIFYAPWGVTLQLGIVVGAALGLLLQTLLTLLQALLVGLLYALAAAGAGLLRGVDGVSLLLKKLHKGMVCPTCYEKIGYPVYECRRADCRRRHPDIRPGRYGIVRRRCACGERLPTLILLMRRERRLQPYCPYCESSMSEATGHMAEAVLPFFGGQAAGKTQLMAAMMLTLESESAPGGREMRTADDSTRLNYEVLREVLQIQGHPRGTQVELPRAYSVVVRRGRGERMLHLFDTAGERFVSRDGTDALRYVQAARTFLFVLDPLAVAAFWNLPAQRGPHIPDRTLASRIPPDLVFQQSVQAMIQMDAPLKQSRLAVAVSKADLYEPPAAPDAAEWLTRELGLGNLIRSMGVEFKEVRYFFTAAVTTGDGTPHTSLAALADWCLDDGVKVAG
ncbi:hypothetical protein AB0M28_33535 [Streptomyces sp. NPDC051940]|uniref:TRAFAC clade GTPase domain-containing protein n=1 Tax=Streptomyces sp. NPDC051940 TaxID=3155675 RepID=UPI00343AEC87